jgi:hypothetical protein
VGQHEAIPGVKGSVEHSAHGDAVRRPLVKRNRARRAGLWRHGGGPAVAAPAAAEPGRAR